MTTHPREPASPYSLSNLFGLGGAVAIVTGATSGIGLVTAEALARAGARVLVTGMTDAESVAAHLRGQGLQAIGRDGDITTPDAADELVGAALSEWGRLDTVFANAGAALDPPPGGDPGERLASLDRMFDLHVRSVAHLADTALPAIAETGGGLFLIMSSIAGLRGNKALGGYGVTKAANAQLARNLAVQWGPQQVRVNALAPGVIDTDFARPITADHDIARARIGKTPLGRFGTPAEVAGAAVWLASPSGAFVTGQTIVIDGGTLIAD